MFFRATGFLLAASLAAPQTRPDRGTGAQKLLDSVRSAMGGAEQIARIRKFRHVQKAGSQTITTTWCAASGYLIETGSEKRYFDGHSAGWSSVNGYVKDVAGYLKMPAGVVGDFGLGIDRFIREHLWFPLLMSNRVRPAGPQTLRFENESGDSAVIEVDPSRNLPLREFAESHAKDTIAFSDWREVKGVMLPFLEQVSYFGLPTITLNTVSWDLNARINCLTLGVKPAELKPAVPAPVMPRPPLSRPAPPGDSAAQGIALLKRIQAKLGGLERLMNVVDYERVVLTMKPTPTGEMSKPARSIEKGCITGETYGLTPDGELFVGNQSGWIYARGMRMSIPESMRKDVLTDHFHYEFFNLALSDRMPGRRIKLVNASTVRILDTDGNSVEITVDRDGRPTRKVSRYYGKDSIGEPLDDVLSEWKAVDGILLPHRLTGYRAGRLEREVTVESWKLNTGLDCSELASRK